MSCNITCAIAVGLIVMSLATLIGTKKSLLLHTFMDTLNDKQKGIYYEIIQQRFGYFIQGKILGLLIAGAYLYHALQNNMEVNSIVCMVVLIIFSTQYIYYKMMPKTKWMLEYLDKPDQIKSWLEVYKYMNHRLHGGFLFGIIGYGLLVWSQLTI